LDVGIVLDYLQLNEWGFDVIVAKNLTHRNIHELNILIYFAPYDDGIVHFG
jgi:hypothetical protein